MESDGRLIISVGVALITHDGKLLLQHRDNFPNIYFPNKIGLFGGLVDAGETPLEAIRREIREELSIDLAEFTLRCIAELNYVGEINSRRRHFYAASVGASKEGSIRITEGQACLRVGFHSLPSAIEFVPFDLAFILYLLNNHKSQH